MIISQRYKSSAATQSSKNSSTSASIARSSTSATSKISGTSIQISNAAKLLAAVVELLRQEVNFAEVNVFKKETYTRNAAPELLERMAACSDIALVAIGD